MHVEHADQVGAGFLRLDHVLGGEDARHVPDLEILLDLRQRILEALVVRRKDCARCWLRIPDP